MNEEEEEEEEEGAAVTYQQVTGSWFKPLWSMYTLLKEKDILVMEKTRAYLTLCISEVTKTSLVKLGS